MFLQKLDSFFLYMRVAFPFLSKTHVVNIEVESLTFATVTKFSKILSPWIFIDLSCQ